MDCEKAKEKIIDLFYDELDPNGLAILEDHLTVCDSCSEYKQKIQSVIECLDQQKEFQSNIDLITLHDSITKKKWEFSHLRIPIWATAFLVLLAIVLSYLALSKAEIQYAKNTLTIRFGEAIAEPVDQMKFQEKLDDLEKRTARILAEQKKEQLQLQTQLTKEMEKYQKMMLELIRNYESDRNVQLAKLIQQIQIQNYQSLMAMKNEFDIFASKTENEFKRSYITMAELLSYQGRQ